MKEKNIVLNTEQDIGNFYKKIWIYKSIFYRNVKFNLEDKTNNVMCKNIIEALNIKNKKKRINFVYDKACEYIDDYNNKQEISCEFKDGKCIHQYNTERYNGCCSLCRYQSEKGCVTQNISCKLFFCDSLCKKYKILKFRDLKIFNCLSLRNRIIIKNNFFTRKETFLKELYFNSLILYAILVFVSMIKNMIFGYKKKHC